MHIFFGLFGFLGACIFLLLIVISLFTKNNMKRNLICFFLCSFLFFVCISLSPDHEPNEDSEQNAVAQGNMDDIQADPGADDLDGLEETITLPIIESEPTEEDKEAALKIDSAIWDRVTSAEKNYNNLLTAMEKTDSLYSLYRFCEDLESLMTQYSTDVSNISDKKAEEYTDCAGMYFYQISSISGHVKKYVDKNNMSELSKAQDGISNLNSFTSAIVIARFSYLSSCGFTDEEIINIAESSVE